MPRLLRGVLVALLGISATLVGILLLAANRGAPSWYQPPDPAREEVALLADRVEYRLIEETQKIREEQVPWTLRVREAQINAWLAARLPAWIAHEQGWRWPDELGTPQVRLEEERVSLALPLGGADDRRVLVARLRPEIDEQGLSLRVERLRLGRLNAPGDPVDALVRFAEQTGLVERFEGTAWSRVTALLAGRERIDPVLTLGDGRRVRILGLRCHDGAIDLTSETSLTEISAP